MRFRLNIRGRPCRLVSQGWECVDLQANSPILGVACGMDHTIFHTIDTLYVYGLNQCGQCGILAKPHIEKWTAVTLSWEIRMVVCGNYFSIVLGNTLQTNSYLTIKELRENCWCAEIIAIPN